MPENTRLRIAGVGLEPRIGLRVASTAIEVAANNVHGRPLRKSGDERAQNFKRVILRDSRGWDMFVCHLRNSTFAVRAHTEATNVRRKGGAKLEVFVMRSITGQALRLYGRHLVCAV